MKILAKQNRELIMINAQNTQNENDAEKILLQVPEQYEDFNKKIVFVTPAGNVWDIITNNEYLIPKAITKYKQVDFYIWLTQGNVDFRTQTKTLKFYHNVDASEEITPEEISGVNTVVNLLEEEITKVENKETELNGIITDLQHKLDTGYFNGTNGSDGEDGESAYQIWIEQGNQGTEQDFLNSLKGHDGTNGVNGTNGQDGISPTASVQQTSTGATISITDKNGTTTVQITNGQDGTNGTNGQDGYTPVRGVDYWTDEDITGIENHCDDYADEIIADLEEQVEDLQKNQLIEPASGTSINLSNSADSRVKSITLNGNSVQKTIEESNLFDINNANYFNGYINTTSQKLQADNGYKAGYIQIEPNKTYFVEKQEGKAFRIATTTILPANDVAFNATVVNHTGTELSITTGENDNYLVFLCWSSANGDTMTANEMYNTVKVYTEREIKSAGDNGSIVEKFVNKNLLNFPQKDATWAGASVKINKNYITFVGNSNGQLGLNYNTGKIPLKILAGSKIVYSSKYVSGEYTRGSTYYNLKLRFNDNTSYNLNMQRYIVNYKKDISVSYTLPKDVIEIEINGSGYDIQGLYGDLIFKFQLECGTQQTSFEEHQEQTYTIPCQQPMRSIENVKDTFVKINGNWIERHYITRILSYNGEEITTAYMSTTGELSTGATVDYVLEIPLDLTCTQAQITVLEALSKARTYKNITHIYSEDEVPANVNLTYYRDLETVWNNTLNDLITRVEVLESEV